jgi:hypothetical protein
MFRLIGRHIMLVDVQKICVIPFEELHVRSLLYARPSD